MELYQIDHQNHISVDDLRRQMDITEQAFELQKEQFDFKYKKIEIGTLSNMEIMSCKSACQFLSWYLELHPSNTLRTFWQNLRSYTKKIPKRVLSRSLRIEIAFRQQYKCNKCLAFPIPPNFEVDHIIELQDGGQDIASNLQALCPACHAEKTRLNRLCKNEIFKKEMQPEYEKFTLADKVFSKYFSKNTL